MKARYESTILEHAGIRLIEPALFKGYDPHKKTFFHEIVVVRDLEPISVASREEAESFKVCTLLFNPYILYVIYELTIRRNTVRRPRSPKIMDSGLFS